MSMELHDALRSLFDAVAHTRLALSNEHAAIPNQNDETNTSYAASLLILQAKVEQLGADIALFTAQQQGFDPRVMPH